jgi:hypothetical protein
MSHACIAKTSYSRIDQDAIMGKGFWMRITNDIIQYVSLNDDLEFAWVDRINVIEKRCKFNTVHSVIGVLSHLSEWHAAEVEGNNGKLIMQMNNIYSYCQDINAILKGNNENTTSYSIIIRSHTIWLFYFWFWQEMSVNRSFAVVQKVIWRRCRRSRGYPKRDTAYGLSLMDESVKNMNQYQWELHILN